MISFSKIALAAAVAAAGFAAQASPVASIGASTAGTAQVLNPSDFSSNFVATVTNSTGQPHVEVTRSTGLSTSYDFYRFASATVGPITIDFDTVNNTDMEVGIWNLAGTLLAANDDNNYDGGGFVFDAAIVNLNVAAGDYIIGVCRFNCVFANNFGVSGNGLGTGGAYVMNVSANVPEPGSLALAGLALAGLGLASRRKRAA